MRRRRRRIIMAMLLVILVVTAAYAYVFHLGGLERFVVGRLNHALGEPSHLTVSLERIRGNLFSGLVLEGVSVIYADSAQTVPIANISHLAAQYSFPDIWRRTYHFKSIYLDGVDLTVPRVGDGSPLLPLPERGRGGDSPSFVIEQLGLDNARIRIDRRADTLWVSDLDLSASLRSEGGTLSVEIKQLDFVTSDPAVGVDHLTGRATYANGALLFQDVLLVRDDTRLKLSGALDAAELSGSAELAADNLDLKQVSALIGTRLRGVLDINGLVAFDQSGINGQVSLGGEFLFAGLENLFVDFSFTDRRLVFDTLYGTILGNCGIDGSAEIDFATSPEQYRLRADVRDFDLRQLVEGSFASDLTGRLELEGESFSNATMQLKLDVDLHESSFDEYPLHHAAGPINITTDSLTFPAAFQVDYFENRFYAVGTVDYGGEMLLEVDADLANLDRYRGRLFIDQPGGRGHAEATLSGRTSDPDLSGRFASDSLWVYGLYADTAHSVFDIDRFLSGRQGSVEIDLASGSLWSVPYDTGYGLIKLDSQLVRIDTVSFRSSYASLSSAALLDQGVYPWRLAIDTLSLLILDRDFYNKSQMVIEIDSLGFAFCSTSIGKDYESIVADRRINFDETMDLTVEADSIPVAPWLHLFEQDLELEADLSGEARLAGAFASPVFSVTGSLDSIVFRDVPLGDLTGSVKYRDRLLAVDSIVIRSDPGVYRAQGQFHTDLSFVDGVDERLPDLPFDLTITATDTVFRLVPLFLPSVEHLGGDLYANLRLNGTPGEPHLDGQAYLKGGWLKYFDLVDTVRTDSAAFLMTDNRIRIDTIKAYVTDDKGQRNNVNVSGEIIAISLDSLYYDVEIDIPEELPFKYDLDDIEGVIQGDLQVQGVTPPVVTGDLSLVSGKYRVEFADDETGSPLMLALSGENTWDLNINIEIPSNYWIKNEDIDAEFSGFLNIIREEGQYRFIGELEVLRGKGYLFDKTFRIIPDSARVIFEGIEHLNPRLDIWARSRIPLSRAGEEERSHEDLKVHVTGTLDNPEFAFFLEGEEGDASLSYEAIIPLIVANYYGRESAGGAIEERISQLVSSQVSQIATRRIGVETFEIDPTYEGYLDLARTRVTLGFYTSQNLYLWGRQDVAFGHRLETGFEYRFNKWLLLEGFRDEIVNEGERYHLNLKGHVEF